MPSKTIKSFIADINNSDADGGGLWLPNIQRFFVWDEDQMERLYDSIMRQYPLPSLLIWKSKSEIRNRRFIDQYHEPVDLKSLYRPISKKTKRLVLDGQQRLQTLFIGLKGSLEGRTLHFDVLSGLPRHPEDVHFKFKFLNPKEAVWPWVSFSDIIYNKKLAGEVARDLVSRHDASTTDEDLTRISRNVERAKREFEVTEALIYHEIDSTDEDSTYTVEDIVEIFIRANAGGTKLSKSDLMFSLVASEWHTADIEMHEFLSEVNGEQFDFDRDFVLKAAMVLLDQGARYDVEKLRTKDLRERITKEWDGITQSIRFVRDFLSQKTFIRCDKALPSYLALIPLIYFRHHFPNAWASTKGKVDYLLRVLLTGAFSGRPDGLIDKIVDDIKNSGAFRKTHIFGIIREDGRSLALSDTQLFDMGYGSRNIHLIFNLWHPRANYTPLWDGHLPQIDHVFPRSLLKKVKDENPDTGRMSLQRYSAAEINQLANCMLLPANENGAGDKGSIAPEIWLDGKSSEFLELHCIPTNKKLWRLENYENFLGARKKLIREKFSHLLFEANED
ncbi:hypothetical protein WT72_26230 [Burkholderia pseudomultivorans]|uniref:GmrSD restriction endonuclease domain-containing protein n=1 Tax=Burkholderia pseudomultivorans TaxID=1207504 RepID=UPI000756651B|nr:DUF262 domain-containing protein [Burkholderia pseudomultivorans]KWI50641.1 hypothetical protein WT72_26230 [Burkholderia pseudomultivorans]